MRALLLCLLNGILTLVIISPYMARMCVKVVVKGQTGVRGAREFPRCGSS